jgi:hypothetical protein
MHQFALSLLRDKASLAKLKAFQYTPWRRWRERRYSSYLFSTLALDRGEWSASRPRCALPPRNGPPVPIRQESGWAPEPVWTQRLKEKSFCLCRGSSLYRPVVQPIARHYTDWATWHKDFLTKMWYSLTEPTLHIRVVFWMRMWVIMNEYSYKHHACSSKD